MKNPKQKEPSQPTSDPTFEQGTKDPAAAKVPAKPPKAPEPPLTAEEEAFIASLANVWQPHALKDLEVRLEVGKLLNAQFGEPPNLQKRCEHILDKAAELLDISTSDLSRMRWFAHHVQKSDPNQQHLGCRNWSKVKEKIADLNNPDKSESKKGEKSLKRLRKELFDALTVLEDHIQKIKDHITVNELKDIAAKVDVLVAIVDRISEPVQKPARLERSLAS